MAASPARAQLQMPAQPNQNLADFRQKLDAFEWNYLLGYGGAAGLLRYAAGVSVVASMLQTTDENKWKDLQIGHLTFARPLARKVRLLARLEATRFRDQLSNFNYARRQSALTLAAALRMPREIHLQPELGMRWERRAELRESGPYGALLVDVPQLRLGEYDNRLQAWGELTRYRNRRNGNASLRYTVWREFAPGARDSLAAHFDVLRRDNFFSDPLSGRIESLRKSERGVENFLTYAFSANAEVRVRTRLSAGRVAVQRLDRGRMADRRSHDDFDFQNLVRLSWRSGSRLQIVELEAGESAVNYDFPDSSGFTPFSRRFATLGYDVEERFTRAALWLHWRIGNRDSLRLFAEVHKIEHDNTDARNPDSYDEQRWQAAIRHEHRVSRNLSFLWEGNVFLKHFLYLDARFSAQNNWTRLFQLRPAVRWRTRRFEFQQIFGVRAQYVDYDFDELQPISGSYVIRDLFAVDSLAAAVAPTLRLHFYYRYEQEELGSLNWRRFASRPRTQWANHWLSLQLEKTFSPAWRYATGVVFFQQTRFQFESRDSGLRRKKTGVHTNLGPRVQLLYRGSNSSSVLFSGERLKIFPFSGRAYFINNIQLSVQWRF